jgi:hypothetical protein
VKSENEKSFSLYNHSVASYRWNDNQQLQRQAYGSAHGLRRRD